MSTVNTLVTNILTNIATVLPSYSQLDFVYDISKNTFKNSAKRYGCLPLEATETDGVTKAYTVDHRFRVILTNDWDTSQIGDSDLRDKVIELQDNAHSIAQEVYENRNFSSTLWMGNISVSEPELLEDNHVLVINLEFDLRYRKQLN